MINAIQIQDSLLTDQPNVSIPYSTETLALHSEMRRFHQPISALKTSKFRKLFDRHRPVLGYR